MTAIGPYEPHRWCECCGLPIAECECDFDDVTDSQCPCGNGCWNDGFDDPPPAIVTIDTGGLT